MFARAVLLALAAAVVGCSGQTRGFFDGPASGPGDTTYYKTGSPGNCNVESWLHGGAPFQPTWAAEGGAGNKIWPVAMNNIDYANGMSCGMCIAASGTGSGSGRNPLPTNKIRYGVVVDRCPECGKGSVDWRDNTQLDGRFGMKWYPVQCPVGATKLQYKTEGSNVWYLKLSIRNSRVPVSAVAIDCNHDGNWANMAHSGTDHAWIYNSGSEGLVRSGCRLRVSSVLGGAVVENNLPLRLSGTSVPDQQMMGTVQFNQRSDYRIALSGTNPLPTKPGAKSHK